MTSMTSRLAIATLGLALSVSAAHAAPAFPSVESGHYAVEPGHTQVTFSVLHIGFTNYSGLFSNVSGSLDLNSAHPEKSKLDVTIPVGSVQTTSSVLTGELKEANWLDATQFPNATFVSTQVVPTGKGTADIKGNFTLHGVTKPVTLHARYIGSGVNPLDKAYTVGFEATGTIQRSQYGIKTYLPMIGDDVTLSIAGAFEKAK